MAVIRYRPHVIILLLVAALALVILHQADDIPDPRHYTQDRIVVVQQPPERDVMPLVFEPLPEIPVDDDETDQKLVSVDRDVPLVWVGGVPRSGTTLMRAMLDAHHDIRCGEETHVIPRLLDVHKGIVNNRGMMSRLELAHIDKDVLEAALGAYLLTIIEQHGPPADYLCNKDPFTLTSIKTIVNMFPGSKFLLMVRDGRASAHSIVSRKIKISGWDIETYEGALKGWNKSIGIMYDQCLEAGNTTCLPVYYEQLVLHPESQMRNILTFLGIKWDEDVLHHEEAIGKKDGVSLSKREPSTNQVNKPVNLDALTKWAEFIPEDVKEDIETIAPMLRKLGYDPHAYPPNYGKPDEAVIKNTNKVNKENNIIQDSTE